MENSQSNLEQANITGKNLDGNMANEPVRVLTAKTIIGTNVENRQGEKLGEIKDIMLNLEKGNVEYVILEHGGILGVGEKLFATPFNALQINTEKEVFLLDREKEFLENAPGFDKDHWPETNSKYITDTHYYWEGPTNPSVRLSTPEFTPSTVGERSTPTTDSQIF